MNKNSNCAQKFPANHMSMNPTFQSQKSNLINFQVRRVSNPLIEDNLQIRFLLTHTLSGSMSIHSTCLASPIIPSSTVFNNIPKLRSNNNIHQERDNDDIPQKISNNDISVMLTTQLDNNINMSELSKVSNGKKI